MKVETILLRTHHKDCFRHERQKYVHERQFLGKIKNKILLQLGKRNTPVVSKYIYL